MAYNKTDWQPRQGTDLNRFATDQPTIPFILLTNQPTSISNPGTPFNVANMNKIEQGIFDAHKKSDAIQLPVSNNRIMIDELFAIEGVNNNVGISDSIFYDFPASTKQLTAGEIDLTKAYAETVTQGLNTLDVTSMNVGAITDFKAGQEVTLQDATEIVNDVVNGDFSDGTNNWNNISGLVWSVNNNIATITNLGGSSSGFKLYQGGKKTVSGHEYFIAEQMKSNSSSDGIAFLQGITLSATHSGSGNFEWIYATGIASSTGSVGEIRALNTSRTGDISSNPVQIKDVFIIDKTALGIESYTEQQMLELVQKGYFESTSVTQKELLTIQSVTDPTITFTSNIANTYSAGANIYRSNLKVDGDVWKFGGFTSEEPDTNQTYLLHMDGPDGSTTFTDENGNIWTANGNAQIDTSQSKFGGASGLFDGSGDWISTPDSDGFNFLADDFTIDLWIKRNGIGGDQVIFGQADAGFSGSQFYLYFTPTTNILKFNARWNDFTSALVGLTAITDTNWHHIAAVRNGNTLSLYIDGVLSESTDVTGKTMENYANPLSIGRAGNFNGQYYNGWVDEFRISKGIARWTAPFTPPTEPYTGNIGTEIDLTEVDVRMNITSWEDVDSLTAWLFTNNNANLALDSKLSIVAQADNESYVDLAETEVEVDGSNNYYVSAGSVATPDDKVTLKYNLTRSLTTDDIEVKRLQGAVA